MNKSKNLLFSQMFYFIALQPIFAFPTASNIDLSSKIKQILPLVNQYAPPQFQTFINDFLNQLMHMTSTGGANTRPSALSTASSGLVLSSSSIPAQYKPTWNKIPSDLQQKLQQAVSSGSINLNSVKTLVNNKDYRGGMSLLNSAGLSIFDALRLQTSLGSK